jgi:hypothetical protein
MRTQVVLAGQGYVFFLAVRLWMLFGFFWILFFGFIFGWHYRMLLRYRRRYSGIKATSVGRLRFQWEPKGVSELSISFDNWTFCFLLPGVLRSFSGIRIPQMLA